MPSPSPNGRWLARIRMYGRVVRLGGYPTKQEALAAEHLERNKYHDELLNGEGTNHMRAWVK